MTREEYEKQWCKLVNDFLKNKSSESTKIFVQKMGELHRHYEKHHNVDEEWPKPWEKK